MNHSPRVTGSPGVRFGASPSDRPNWRLISRRSTRWLILLAVSCVALSGCHSTDTFSARTVVAGEYGEEWPLTVSSAVLACEPGGVLTVSVNGSSYRLEESMTARQADPGFVKVWAFETGSRSQRRELGALISAAAELCE